MNRPTDPPNHPPIHLSKGGSVSTNHKSSNRIELSRLDQVLLKFLWFHMFWPTNPPIHPPTHQRNTHPWVGNFPQIPNLLTESKSHFYWFGRYRPHMCTHTCTHTCTCTCTHTCMHVKHDKHGCLHGGGHLQFPNMFILAFCACACVHNPSAPLPRAVGSHREPKSPKVYKSWTNHDNSILFEKSLPLNISELI